MGVDKSSKILIVGAGVFGLSTAEHLLKRGYASITVLERSEILPAPDAASTDINKIIRSAYSDIFYAQLAKEAIALWKDTAVWGDTYHESGVFVIRESGNNAYIDLSYVNERTLGSRIEDLDTAEAIKGIFPPGVKTSSFEGASGYCNRDGGWAFASQGISILLERVRARGARVLAGKAVVDLIKVGGKSKGVKCADGSTYDADLVVIASGSWTPSTFHGVDLNGKCLATGQTLATIQLTPEEAERYRDVPVVLDFGSGFYSFPPNAENIVKVAIHSNGYTIPSNPSRPAAPRTKLSDGDDGLRIPKEALRALREQLRRIYPELAEKPFSGTRLCWYNDSPDDDWVIGYHPSDANLVLATAGSGHAYKFLPNIGRLVADAIEEKLSPELTRRFALDRHTNAYVSSRRGFPTQPLDLAQLCSPEDLYPQV